MLQQYVLLLLSVVLMYTGIQQQYTRRLRVVLLELGTYYSVSSPPRGFRSTRGRARFNVSIE